jgi:nucleoside-diphosphate kinase
MERAFVMVKPDGVARRLIGRIITMFEEKGLHLVQCGMVQPTEDVLRRHYVDHIEKPFFKDMEEYMLEGMVFISVWEGVSAVSVARSLIGATDPLRADLSSIRGRYGITVSRNLIHGSDSVEAAKREVDIWFRNKNE